MPNIPPPEVTLVDQPRVACDGYGECGYCDRRFVLRGGVADDGAGGDPAAHGPRSGFGAPDHA